MPASPGETRLVFSGDLGRYGQEVMADPHPGWDADYLVVESTYGGRLHDETPIQTALEKLIQGVAARKGVLLIPAFAVGRTQQALYHIRHLEDENRIPHLPVYIDSPMAIESSHIYCRFGDDHNLDVNLLMDERECPLRCRKTNFVRAVEESKQLNHHARPSHHPLSQRDVHWWTHPAPSEIAAARRAQYRASSLATRRKAAEGGFCWMARKRSKFTGNASLSGRRSPEWMPSVVMRTRRKFCAGWPLSNAPRPGRLSYTVKQTLLKLSNAVYVSGQIGKPLSRSWVIDGPLMMSYDE